MLSYYCPECMVNWAPYQAGGGQCPYCHGGTRRVNQPATKGIAELYKALLVTRVSEQVHERFEKFCADRERADLESIGRLPTLDPEA